MGLSPIEISGALSRVTDYAQLKQNEDNKGMVNQTNFSGQFNKQVENRVNTVERGNDANNDQKKFDAKEKGSNEYNGDGGRKHKDSHMTSQDGTVHAKGSTSMFDIRI